MRRMSQELLRDLCLRRVVGIFAVTLLLLFSGLASPGLLRASPWKRAFSIGLGTERSPLRYPLGLYYDATRSILYVADSGNDRLISYTLNGKPLKVFDAAGQLAGPVGMVRERDGSLWVVERPVNSLTFINLGERKVVRHHVTFGGRPVLADKLLLWRDRIVTLDRASGKILVLRKDMTVEKAFFPAKKGFKGFFDVKAKGDVLWGMETLTGRLFGFDTAGSLKATFTPRRRLSQPVSFERDTGGNVYILDRYLKKLFVFNPDGSLRYEMLKRGFNPGQLSYPWQVLMVGERLLVLDEGNGRIDVWKR